MQKYGFGWFLVMRKLIVPLLIFLLPMVATAYQNEPEDFRGIKWGTDISKLPDMVKLTQQKQCDDCLYQKKNEHFKIGDAVLSGIYYSFYKGRFYSVMIHYEKLDNFNKLKDTLTQKYGNGNKSNPYIETYDWFGKLVSISINYKPIATEGSIFYLYNPIREEIEKDNEEKAKKAIEDL